MRQWTTYTRTSRLVAALIAGFLWSTASLADDRADLESLLTRFLGGAASDLDVHQRFWADDLIYTSSAGQRFGKEKIIDGMRNAQSAGSSDEKHPGVRYRAENTDIRIFGDTAVVAFQLVAEASAAAEKGSQVTTNRYFNTGTFIKRKGEWRAVAWQATRIPEEKSDS